MYPVFRTVNEHEYTPIAFGLGVYGELDIALVLYAKADVTWKNLHLSVMVYNIRRDSMEIEVYPFSGAIIQYDNKKTLTKREFNKIIYVCISGLLRAFAVEKLSPFSIRDRVLLYNDLLAMSTITDERLVHVYQTSRPARRQLKKPNG